MFRVPTYVIKVLRYKNQSFEPIYNRKIKKEKCQCSSVQLRDATFTTFCVILF